MRATGWISGKPTSRASQASPGLSCQMAMAQGADVQAPVGIDRMEATAHIFQAGAETGECIGLQIDVAECDDAGASGLHQAIALPVNAGVTDRAFGIVVDGQK